MRIDSLAQTYSFKGFERKKAPSPKAEGASSAQTIKDAVSISFGAVEKASNDKLSAIKQKISAGTYNTDPVNDDLAEKMAKLFATL